MKTKIGAEGTKLAFSMKASGHTNVQIAKALHVHVDSVGRMFRRNGLLPRHYGKEAVDASVPPPPPPGFDPSDLRNGRPWCRARDSEWPNGPRPNYAPQHTGLQPMD